TDDDNIIRRWGKLPADFVERFRLPSDLMRQLRAAAALPPETVRALNRLKEQNDPEVRQVLAEIAQKRKQRQAIDESLQTYETWLADRGMGRESRPTVPRPQDVEMSPVRILVTLAEEAQQDDPADKTMEMPSATKKQEEGGAQIEIGEVAK